MPAACLLALLAGLLAGCGSNTVEVKASELADAAGRACAAFVADAPKTLADQARRKVSGNEYAVAYGDPAIVVRCGVGRPRGYDRFASCQRANGIDWFVAETEKVAGDQSLDVLMTTVGRTPAIEVQLPAQYRPPIAAMVDLETSIRADTRKTGGCV